MSTSLLYQLSFHNVTFSFTWSSDCSEADAGEGHKAIDNFMEHWTQVVSGKELNVYTMRAATQVTTLIIKITISSIVNDLTKKTYFPTIHLPSFHWTVR